MHDELKSPDTALPRLVHDTFVHLVRQSGGLATVRVALPTDWDHPAFAAGMVERFAEKGHPGVSVTVLPTAGEPRLLSVLIGR